MGKFSIQLAVGAGKQEKRPLEEAVASGDVAQVLASVSAMAADDVRDFVDADGNTLLHLVCTKCTRNVTAAQLAAVVPEPTFLSTLKDPELLALAGVFLRLST